MKIVEIFKKNMEDFWHVKKPTIAFLGDSVTQGCFELYIKKDGNGETVFDPEYAYHRNVAKILGMLYPQVPVNIVNAGLSGGNVIHANERLKRDVLSHNPDLTVVCFGLNDCNNKEDGLIAYYEALVSIFTRLKEAGSEVIFMTPNMMNTYVSGRVHPAYTETAQKVMKLQNEGVLDKYIDKAKEAAALCDVRVCDVYAKWKLLYENGVEITELLSNGINHPSREMNWLFAYSLVEEMMK